MADANITNKTNVEHIKKYLIIIIFYNVHFFALFVNISEKKYEPGELSKT